MNTLTWGRQTDGDDAALDGCQWASLGAHAYDCHLRVRARANRLRSQPDGERPTPDASPTLTHSLAVAASMTISPPGPMVTRMAQSMVRAVVRPRRLPRQRGTAPPCRRAAPAEWGHPHDVLGQGAVTSPLDMPTYNFTCTTAASGACSAPSRLPQPRTAPRRYRRGGTPRRRVQPAAVLKGRRT